MIDIAVRPIGVSADGDDRRRRRRHRSVQLTTDDLAAAREIAIRVQETAYIALAPGTRRAGDGWGHTQARTRTPRAMQRVRRIEFIKPPKRSAERFAESSFGTASKQETRSTNEFGDDQFPELKAL